MLHSSIMSITMVLIHYPIVSMMHSYNTGELLTKATFMHHDDKGHFTLKHYPALYGLNIQTLWVITFGVNDVDFDFNA